MCTDMKIYSVVHEKDMQELIQGLSEGNNKLIIKYDEFEDAPKCVKKITKDSGELLPPYNYEQLEKWLYPGNWQIFLSNKEEISEVIYTFKSNKEEIIEYMTKNQILLLIDSFHDNVEWNVCDNT